MKKIQESLTWNGGLCLGKKDRGKHLSIICGFEKAMEQLAVSPFIRTARIWKTLGAKRDCGKHLSILCHLKRLRSNSMCQNHWSPHSFRAKLGG